MNELQIINEQQVLGKDFKVYGTYEDPLFLAKDVANWIEYDVSSVNKMLNTVDDDEKIKLHTRINNPSGSDLWFLTEYGLYEVLMQSRKAIAKQFKKEVKKILKTLRTTGIYSVRNNMSSEKPSLSSVNEAAEIIRAAYKEAGADPLFALAAIGNLYKEQTGLTLPMPASSKYDKLYDYTEIAKELNIYSKSNKPHTKAVSAIIQKLDIAESLIVRTPFTKNGHSGFTVQYKSEVFRQVEKWLKDNNYPAVIKYNDIKGNESTCKVSYKKNMIPENKGSETAETE